GEDAALKCMRLFIRAYAREAADLALKTLAFGGVYIAGGIAPKIKEAFLVLGFRGFFEDKGRMKKVLKEIPVFICLHPYLGLLGAGIRSDRGPM
ncbi:MAG TPA: glucokinase, partial [Dissulfuribacter thermophilus]|nr:glucokinase [Dissulfuribacter thermophilus]